jgi:hypothetical protein
MGHTPHLGRDVVSRWCGGDPMLAKKRAMSPVGHSRLNWSLYAMSGLPPIATELRTSLVVRFVPPISDMAGTLAKEKPPEGSLQFKSAARGPRTLQGTTKFRSSLRPLKPWYAGP